MADKINRQEVIIWLAKVLVKTSNLTRGSRKKYHTTICEETLHIFICILHAGLHIFGAHEGFYLFHILSIIYYHLPILIKASTKDDTIFFDDLFCKDVEDASRGTLESNLLVLVDSCKYFERFSFFVWLQFIAHLFTEGTVYTGIHIDLRIKKPFIICNHLNASFRTNGCTGTTATTIMFINYINHFENIRRIGLTMRFFSSSFILNI